MRVVRRMAAVLAATALLTSAVSAAAAGSPCGAVAERPRTVRIDGRPFIAARHAVVCEGRVAEIVVRGSLMRDGDGVARAGRTCSWASACVVETVHPDPPGVQVWRGRTAGDYTTGGATRSVPAVSSPLLKA